MLQIKRKTISAPVWNVVALALLLTVPFASGAAVTSQGDTGLNLVLTPDPYTIREVQQDGDLYRRIEQFGTGRIDRPGEPDLPLKGLWVAVPEGHTVRARLLSSECKEIPGPRVEPALRDTILGRGRIAVRLPAFDETVYSSHAWYPSEEVRTGEVSRFRHQALVPIQVALFRVIPSTGALRVCTRMEIRIDFIPDRAAKNVGARERVGDEGRWEEMYRGCAVNYDQARSFRSRSARRGFPAGKRAVPSLDEYKLAVKDGGLYRVSFSNLQSAGLSAGYSTQSLSVYRRGFDDGALERGEDPFTQVSLPLVVDDAGGDGLFGTGDAFFVYLPGFHEDRMKNDFDDRYAEKSIYFFSVEGSITEPAVENGWKGFTGLDPLHSFPDSVRWEVDTRYNTVTPSDTLDLYFAMKDKEASRVTEIVLPAVDTLSLFGVKMMTVSTGKQSTWNTTYHRYRLTAQKNGLVVRDVSISRRRGWLIPADKVHEGSSLTTGVNRFLYEGSRGPNEEANEVSGAMGYLDWYEIHTDFLYSAVDDYIEFSTGTESGRVQMEIAGFTSPDIVILDLADPYAPVRVAVDSVREDGDRYTAVIQDSAGTTRRYAAATASGAKTLASSAITADTPTALASEEGDYLIITHEEFADEMNPLAAHRESQGYTVRIARVGDVYDEFNGGIKDPKAIYRYLKYGFEQWSRPPGWTLLVGDGYEDCKGIATNYASDSRYSNEVDFIPTNPIYKPGYHNEEGEYWDASDLMYVLFDGSGDKLPDLLIGRFPVGTRSEAAEMVEKTVGYENFRPEDTWRGRAIFLADDAWTWTEEVMSYANQPAFREASERFAVALTEHATRGIDTVKVFSSRFTDLIHPLCPYEGDPDNPKLADGDCVIEKCRDTITPALFNELNGAGAFLLNFQGHGNRNVLTHEVIVRNGYDYRHGVSQDICAFTDNADRLYILMAYGCSISEFDNFTSFGYESIPEEMVLNDDGGAVASFGSSAEEYLDKNIALNEAVLKYMYQTPGVIPGADPESLLVWNSNLPVWSLGEIINLGLIDYAANIAGGDSVVRRYMLFGDPALVIDALPPRFEVTVDGEPVSDGDPLLGREDGSAVAIVAIVHDEVVIDPDSISITEGGEPVDSALYTIGIDSALSDDGRSWRVLYSPEINFGEYEIVFRAVDRNGRESLFHLEVRVGVEVTFDGFSIRGGDYVAPEPLLRAEITTPVPIEERDLQIEIDGALITPDSLYAVDQFRWVATVRPSLSDGAHTFLIRIQGLEKSVSFRVEKRLRIVDLMNYPNPSSGGTGFFYYLTGEADRVTAEVFTVAGRRIRVVEGLAGRVGYNENEGVWDGRDQDGDEIANGVYIYRLTARGSGMRAEATGKAILAR